MGCLDFDYLKNRTTRTVDEGITAESVRCLEVCNRCKELFLCAHFAHFSCTNLNFPLRTQHLVGRIFYPCSSEALQARKYTKASWLPSWTYARGAVPGHQSHWSLYWRLRCLYTVFFGILRILVLQGMATSSHHGAARPWSSPC